MRLTITLLFLLGLVQANAQNYAVESIPENLRKGSDAVIRKRSIEVEILDEKTANHKEEFVVTIFNKDAVSLGYFYEVYDKLRKIKGININYYDKNGKLLKRVKNHEIQDFSGSDSGELDDSRVKYYEPEPYDFPFTMAYEFEFEYSSTMWFPNFIPSFGQRIGVEYASYKAVVPALYELRYKLFNGLEEPVSTINDKGNKEMLWEIRNLEPFKKEYMSSTLNSMIPHALISPSTFQMEGYSGDMSSWEAYGEWQAKLNKGRDELTDEVKAEISRLVANIDDPREKARKIYQYMQSNTRYVSIQLGIGGYQPFPAKEVIRTGYGDCKALTNYTYSLLKHAGIKSNYVIIKAGENERDIHVDFPNPRFNHVILAVPFEKDTVWLECTNQLAPFNYLGDFTDDRHALLITDEGKGKIVKTPKYTAEDNLISRTIRVTMDTDGNAQVKAQTDYTGVYYGNLFYLARDGKEDQRKYLLNSIDLPTFDLGDFLIEDNRMGEEPVYTEKINFQVRKFGAASGKRMFISPNILSRLNEAPPKSENRKAELRIQRGQLTVDTVKIQLPEGYRLEFPGEDQDLTTEFGYYKAQYSFDHETNELTYVRHFQLNDGTYAPDRYEDYRSFLRDVVKLDKTKLVLIGST